MNDLSVLQRVIIIALCSFGTILMRFLPFLIFRGSKPVPQYVHFLGKALPSAIFAMLVVYCLKSTSVFNGNHAIPELLGILSTTLLYITSKKNMMLSIFGGTLVYMGLVQFIF